MSAAKVALGARLFADTRLSVTGRVFLPELPLAASAPSPMVWRARAARLGETLPLNAPTLLNAAYNASLGWKDPGVRTLEQQMRGPLFNEHPPELGLAGREAEVEAALVSRCADGALTSPRPSPAKRGR